MGNLEEMQKSLEPLKLDLLELLRIKTRMEVINAISRILGEGDIIVLSGIGIDGRKEMLDIFIEECRTIKKEIEDA